MKKPDNAKELVNEKVAKQNGSRENSLPPLRGRVGVGGSLTMGKYEPRPCGCSTRELVHNHFPARKGWGLRDGYPLIVESVRVGYNDECYYAKPHMESGLPPHLTHLTHFKKAATQIIRGAAKARFRRTLRAGLADARTAPYRKFGFTLAEVLITLGVIGIVAAMTIPNLVQSYKKKVVETKLAKFYSMMNNAIKLAEVDYGPQSTWTDYHIDHNSNGHGGFAYDKGDKIDAVVQKYFAPYLKITGQEDFYDIPVIDNGLNQPQKIYYLSDGSAFSFGLHENREIFFYPFDPKKCLMTEKSPNGRCRFAFAFIPITSEGYDGFKYNKGNGMQPHLGGWDGNEDSLMNSDSFWACNDDGAWCTEIILRNGWKIPDNYPYKL